MEKINYADITKELLGDSLYYEFIREISKEHGNTNLVDFGKEVIDKCCLLIVMLGMSKVKLDNVKLCLGDKVIEISCKKFADKYKTYTDKISENLLNVAKQTDIAN